MFKAAIKISVLFSLMLMVLTPVYAQQTTPPAGQQQAAEPPADDTDDTQDAADNAAEQAQSELPDIDNQPIQPGSGGPGRFIPSEQISQDLGVSFPVDI